MADHGDRPLFQPSFKGEKSIKGVKLLFLMARSNIFILKDHHQQLPLDRYHEQ